MQYQRFQESQLLVAEEGIPAIFICTLQQRMENGNFKMFTLDVASMLYEFIYRKVITNIIDRLLKLLLTFKMVIYAGD